MNRDDVTRMAREAGLTHQVTWHGQELWLASPSDLERFAAIAYAAGAAAENEACEKVCDALGEAEHMDDYWYRALDKCAAAIRARGN